MKRWKVNLYSIIYDDDYDWLFPFKLLLFKIKKEKFSKIEQFTDFHF